MDNIQESSEPLVVPIVVSPVVFPTRPVLIRVDGHLTHLFSLCEKMFLLKLDVPVIGMISPNSKVGVLVYPEGNITKVNGGTYIINAKASSRFQLIELVEGKKKDEIYAKVELYDDEDDGKELDDLEYDDITKTIKKRKAKQQQQQSDAKVSFLIETKLLFLRLCDKMAEGKKSKQAFLLKSDISREQIMSMNASDFSWCASDCIPSLHDVKVRMLKVRSVKRRVIVLNSVIKKSLFMLEVSKFWGGTGVHQGSASSTTTATSQSKAQKQSQMNNQNVRKDEANDPELID